MNVRLGSAQPGLGPFVRPARLVRPYSHGAGYERKKAIQALKRHPMSA